MSVRALLLAALLVGCEKTTTPLQGNPGVQPTAGSRVELVTLDDVTLVADAWVQSEPAPGVVFLHMTPRGPWTRADWPDTLMESLHQQGLSVIRLDRRGAGESGGEAVDAFEGPLGRNDVEAAVRYLTQAGMTELGVVGASNGSTSAIDYAAWAAGAGHPSVHALAMMSPGTYTENQTAVADLPELPVLVQYPATESDWPASIQASVPATWQFVEYEGSTHGTQLFEAHDAVAAELDAFLVDTLMD